MSAKLKVYRGSKILGDFTLDEVFEGLSKGIFLPTDYFWNPENESEGLQELKRIHVSAKNSSANVRASAGPTKRSSGCWGLLGLWLLGLGLLTIFSSAHGGVIEVYLQLVLPEEWIGCLLEILNHGAIDGLLLLVIGWLLLTR
jgi:hypothetical protein